VRAITGECHEPGLCEDRPRYNPIGQMVATGNIRIIQEVGVARVHSVTECLE